MLDAKRVPLVVMLALSPRNLRSTSNVKEHLSPTVDALTCRSFGMVRDAYLVAANVLPSCMSFVQISVPTLLVFHSAQGGVSAQLFFLIQSFAS